MENKKFRILPEIQRLAAEWDLTVEELLDEVEEIEED